MPLYNLQKNANLKFFLAENRRLSRIGIFRTKRPVSRGPTQSASQMGMCAQPISICHGMRISARGGYFEDLHGCPGTRSGIVLLILLSIIIGARSGILLLILLSIWEPHARYPGTRRYTCTWGTTLSGELQAEW